MSVLPNTGNQNQTVVSILIEEDDYNVLHEGPGHILNKNKREARSQLAALLSLMYAICVALAGVLLPLSEALQDQWLQTHVEGVFAVYVYTVGTAFLIILQAYLIPKSKQNHINAEKKRMETVRSTIFENAEEQEPEPPHHHYRTMNGLDHMNSHGLHERRKSMTNVRRNSMLKISSTHNMDSVLTVSSNVLANDKLASKVWLDAKKLNESFNHDGTSFYLRLGTLVFGLGNMIHTGLEINYHLFQCKTSIYGWTYVFRLLLIFVQTFFILKNAQAHVTVHTRLAKFGFMHLIVTNFYVWFRTLVAEILHQIHLRHAVHDDHGDGYHSNGNHSDYNQTTDHADYADTSSTPDSEDSCEVYRTLLNNASPYLFPFILEYSLIATGIFAVMSLNVGAVEPSAFLHNLQYLLKKAVTKQKKNKAERAEGGQESEHLNHQAASPASSRRGVNTDMHRHDMENRPPPGLTGPLHSVVNAGPVSLHNSHRGIFIGFVVLAVIAVSTIVFFYEKNVGKVDKAQTNYYVVDIFTHSALLGASITALVLLNQLPGSVKPLSVDDVILFISMSGSCFLEFALLLPTINAAANRHSTGIGSHEYANLILSIFDASLAIIETLFQTVLIIAGMRKYTDEKKYKEDGSGTEVMPGRELITFLIVTNVTVWINRSIHVKELEMKPMSEFYGEFAWLLIVNFNLPLLLFFRFHSSVCFADIWDAAYVPLTGDIQNSFVNPRSSSFGNRRQSQAYLPKADYSSRFNNPRLSICHDFSKSFAGIENKIFEEDEENEDEDDAETKKDAFPARGGAESHPQFTTPTSEVSSFTSTTGCDTHSGVLKRPGHSSLHPSHASTTSTDSKPRSVKFLLGAEDENKGTEDDQSET